MHVYIPCNKKYDYGQVRDFAHLIAVTGWGHEEDRQRARESGFDAHLTKPADPEHIVKLVARSVRASDDVQPA